ncbi:hypothetical protein PSH55_07225 [Pseudoalteromonas sp. Angola-31]|nr:hypothetical protein [Pseudoalteromonas sp. Angola-31]
MSKLVLIFLMLVSVIFSGYSYASSFEGCYSTTDKITSATPMLNKDGGESNEHFKLKTSYINIFKEGEKYFTEGLIWGYNFHICTITAPLEGTTEPLPLVLKDKKLVFAEKEPEYDINCKFELEFDENGLNIKDENYHCSNYIFYCGAHAGVHDVLLAKTNKGCN